MGLPNGFDAAVRLSKGHIRNGPRSRRPKVLLICVSASPHHRPDRQLAKGRQLHKLRKPGAERHRSALKVPAQSRQASFGERKLASNGRNQIDRPIGSIKVNVKFQYSKTESIQDTVSRSVATTKQATCSAPGKKVTMYQWKMEVSDECYALQGQCQSQIYAFDIMCTADDYTGGDTRLSARLAADGHRLRTGSGRLTRPSPCQCATCRTAHNTRSPDRAWRASASLTASSARKRAEIWTADSHTTAQLLARCRRGR